MDNNNNLHDRVQDKAQGMKNDIKEKKDEIVDKFTGSNVDSKQNDQKSYNQQDNWKQDTPHDKQDNWKQDTPHDKQESWNQNKPYCKDDSEKKQSEQNCQYDHSQHSQK